MEGAESGGNGEKTQFKLKSSMSTRIEAFGHELSICQNPGSNNCGTTIWDASLALVRGYMTARRSEFCTDRLQGKNVLELGAGCGLAGIAFVLLGANAWLTDLPEILGILEGNVRRNLTGLLSEEMACLKVEGEVNESQSSRCQVLAHCWGEPPAAALTNTHFHYIVCCDCVYADHLIDPLISSLVALADRSTTVIIASEKRDERAYSLFFDQLKLFFSVKKVPKSKMHADFKDSVVEILLCRKRRKLQS